MSILVICHLSPWLLIKGIGPETRLTTVSFNTCRVVLKDLVSSHSRRDCKKLTAENKFAVDPFQDELSRSNLSLCRQVQSKINVISVYSPKYPLPGRLMFSCLCDPSLVFSFGRPPSQQILCNIWELPSLHIAGQWAATGAVVGLALCSRAQQLLLLR